MSKKSIVGLLIAVLLIVSSVMSISALSYEESTDVTDAEMMPMSEPTEDYWENHSGPIYSYHPPEPSYDYEDVQAYTYSYRRVFYGGGYYDDYYDSNSYTRVDVYFYDPETNNEWEDDDEGYGNAYGYSSAYYYLYTYKDCQISFDSSGGHIE